MEAGSLRPHIVAEGSGLGAPADVCQRIQVVADQLSTSKWFARPVLHNVSQADFRCKVARDQVRGEPRELDDLNVRLFQQGRELCVTFRQLYAAKCTSGGECEIIGIPLAG